MSNQARTPTLRTIIHDAGTVLRSSPGGVFCVLLAIVAVPALILLPFTFGDWAPRGYIYAKQMLNAHLFVSGFSPILPMAQVALSVIAFRVLIRGWRPTPVRLARAVLVIWALYALAQLGGPVAVVALVAVSFLITPTLVFEDGATLASVYSSFALLRINLTTLGILVAASVAFLVVGSFMIDEYTPTSHYTFANASHFAMSAEQGFAGGPVVYIEPSTMWLVKMSSLWLFSVVWTLGYSLLAAVSYVAAKRLGGAPTELPKATVDSQMLTANPATLRASLQ